MDMTNEQYVKYVNEKAKPSSLVKNMIWAFVTGGLICVGGQVLMNLYQNAGLFIPYRRKRMNQLCGYHQTTS